MVSRILYRQRKREREEEGGGVEEGEEQAKGKRNGVDLVKGHNVPQFQQSLYFFQLPRLFITVESIIRKPLNEISKYNFVLRSSQRMMLPMECFYFCVQASVKEISICGSLPLT